jgi:hypothetical protein
MQALLTYSLLFMSARAVQNVLLASVVNKNLANGAKLLTVNADFVTCTQ